MSKLVKIVRFVSWSLFLKLLQMPNFHMCSHSKQVFPSVIRGTWKMSFQLNKVCQGQHLDKMSWTYPWIPDIDIDYHKINKINFNFHRLVVTTSSSNSISKVAFVTSLYQNERKYQSPTFITLYPEYITISVQLSVWELRQS